MDIQKLIQDAIEERFKDAEPSMKFVMTEMATYWATFALSLDRWQPIDELENDYEDVLFLFENGDIRKGFRNYLLELMVGNQGRFCSSHDDIENPITHFQPLPSPPSQ